MLRLPELSQIPKLIALDTETYDPGLKDLGPGFITRGSYPIGVSVALSTHESFYYPFFHQTDGNLDHKVISRWLKDVLGDPDRKVVFANAKYDLEALWRIGVEVKSQCYDIQTQEALIDENQYSYSLGHLLERRHLGQKLSSDIDAALFAAGKVKRGKPNWDEIRSVHPDIVGPYAEQDARKTLEVYLQQLRDIERDELERVALLESKLIPILFKMRVQGVRVNLDKAENLNNELGLKLEKELLDLQELTGLSVDPWSPISMSKWVRSQGYEPEKTEKDNDSVTNEFLKGTKNPILVRMAEYRAGDKIRRDFIKAMVLEGNHKGLLHPNWFSTRGSGFHSGGDALGGDVNGTRSGRLACVDPNLCQIPSRHPVYGPLVRDLFESPQNCAWWGKADYATQEPRIAVHYAHALGIDGAEAVFRAYSENPRTDFHQTICDLINAAGVPIDRRSAKTINLGLLYGLGKVNLADRLAMSVQNTINLLGDYHRIVPFVKNLTKFCSNMANSRGYVRTILGRRRRFTEWENGEFLEAGSRREKAVKSQSEALAKWGKIKRAYTYKAANSVIQGSAAEQMKTAIVNLDAEGILPIVQVYDELGVSLQGPDDPLKDKVIEIMENAIPFTVRHVVDMNVGQSWSAK